jgi:DNA-binding GntR family transcriptional regulator
MTTKEKEAGLKPTLSDSAYNILKESILSGQIIKGNTYTQSEISTLLNLAISPLRVAISKLESEGFISVIPRSGIQIIDSDFSLTRNTYQLRVILEREGVKTYIRTVSDQEISYFREEHEQLLDDIKTLKNYTALYKKLEKLDSELHTKFIKSLDNKIITKTYLANEELIRLTRLDRVDLASSEMIGCSIKEHLNLINAIESRDQILALNLLDKHLEQSIKRAMGLWGF